MGILASLSFINFRIIDVIDILIVAILLFELYRLTKGTATVKLFWVVALLYVIWNIEERQLNVAQMDVFSRLMMDRIIFLGTAIDDYVANIIQAQLLFLESTDSKRDIQIYLNSPGGSVYAGLGIYDTMQFINPDVATICTGMAASMAAVLMCAGAKGKRSALPHSRIMIHQPMGGVEGQATEIEITAREIQKLKKELYEIIAKHSGQTYDKVWADSDRDYWMTAEEAKAYGMIDEVLIKKQA